MTALALGTSGLDQDVRLRAGGTRVLFAREHRTQGQTGEAHAGVRQKRSAGHARAAPRFCHRLSRHAGYLLALRQRIVTKS